jgi:hypothetical protein
MRTESVWYEKEKAAECTNVSSILIRASPFGAWILLVVIDTPVSLAHDTPDTTGISMRQRTILRWRKKERNIGKVKVGSDEKRL